MFLIKSQAETQLKISSNQAMTASWVIPLELCCFPVYGTSWYSTKPQGSLNWCFSWIIIRGSFFAKPIVFCLWPNHIVKWPFCWLIIQKLSFTILTLILTAGYLTTIKVRLLTSYSSCHTGSWQNFIHTLPIVLMRYWVLTLSTLGTSIDEYSGIESLG